MLLEIKVLSNFEKRKIIEFERDYIIIYTMKWGGGVRFNLGGQYCGYSQTYYEDFGVSIL